jgi:hypothetical protein
MAVVSWIGAVLPLPVAVAFHGSGDLQPIRLAGVLLSFALASGLVAAAASLLIGGVGLLTVGRKLRIAMIWYIAVCMVLVIGGVALMSQREFDFFLSACIVTGAFLIDSSVLGPMPRRSVKPPRGQRLGNL